MPFQLLNLEFILLLHNEEMPKIAITDDLLHPLIKQLYFWAMEYLNRRNPLIDGLLQPIKCIIYFGKDINERIESG